MQVERLGGRGQQARTHLGEVVAQDRISPEDIDFMLDPLLQIIRASLEKKLRWQHTLSSIVNEIEGFNN